MLRFHRVHATRQPSQRLFRSPPPPKFFQPQPFTHQQIHHRTHPPPTTSYTSRPITRPPLPPPPPSHYPPPVSPPPPSSPPYPPHHQQRDPGRPPNHFSRHSSLSPSHPVVSVWTRPFESFVGRPIEYFPKPIRGIANRRERFLHWLFPNSFSLDGRVIPGSFHRTKFVLCEIVILGLSVSSVEAVVAPMRATLSAMPFQQALLVNTVMVANGLMAYIFGIAMVNKFFPSAEIVPNPQLVKLEPMDRYLRGWARWWLGAAILLTAAYFMRQATEKHNPMGVPFILEDTRLLEYGMDCTNSGWSLPWAGAPVTITGPFLEECMFRGLLFARCARMFGIPFGLVISSIIFGLVHGPAKAIPTGVGGSLFAIFYSVSHSLGLTALLHMGQNTNTIAINNKINPMAPFDEQCKHQAEMEPLTYLLDSFLQVKLLLLQEDLHLKELLGKQRTIWSELNEKLPAFIRRALQPLIDAIIKTNAQQAKGIEQLRAQFKGDMTEVLQDDLKSFKPEFSAAVRDLFHLLDIDRKGYLNVSEFGFLLSSHPRQLVYLNLVNNIIQRRTAELDGTNAKKLSPPPHKTFLMSVGERSREPGRVRDAEREQKQKSERLDAHQRVLAGVHLRYPFFQVEPCALPHELIATRTTKSPTPINFQSMEPPRVYHPKQLAALDTLLHHMPSYVPGLASRPRLPPADTIPLQFFRNWYSLHSLMAYQDFFHHGQLRQRRKMSEVGSLTLNGCTEEAFEKYFIRQFQFEPVLSAQWLERIIRILKNEEQHPVTHLLENTNKPTSTSTGIKAKH